MAVPRISALLMLRSTISTVSAPATCPFRGSITNPTQLLCTLRGRRYRRLTQHLLPGGPLRPYPDRSCTGWTAPAFVGAFVAVGTRVTPRPPHGSVRAPLCIRLVWGFLCQWGSRHFCLPLSFHSFVRPAPRAFFRPDRIFPLPSRAAAVKDGASSAPPKARP